MGVKEFTVHCTYVFLRSLITGCCCAVPIAAFVTGRL